MRAAPPAADLASYVAGEIRAAMARRQLSQQALADLAGVTQSYLARRLVGRVPFDVADLERLAPHLGITVSSLLPAERAL